ncbi:MAG: uroporphyrinogen decarboxylase family protein [Anaerolineae bacterium]
MLPRDRVLAAIAYRAPDVIPLQIHSSPGGLFEHGRKLLDLMHTCGHDFGDTTRFALPAAPEPGDWDADGRYHAFRTDEWGTGWEYRIYGIWGHRVHYPLQDLSALDAYRAPAPPPSAGAEFEAARAEAAVHKERYFLVGGGGLLFEQLQSLRAFDDVLVEIATDAPEINRIADLIAEYQAGCVQRALALDVDAVSFGDDFGTQQSCLLSPRAWRRFFKPRYQQLFEPVRRAGKAIFFHSCGQIGELLPDFADLGVTAIWPQLPVFDLPDLAWRCRDLGLAVQLHPDRGELMQRGTPEEIRGYILRLCETFDTAGGGSWLYLEVDPGFPFENVRALFETAMELRGR